MFDRYHIPCDGDLRVGDRISFEEKTLAPIGGLRIIEAKITEIDRSTRAHILVMWVLHSMYGHEYGTVIRRRASEVNRGNPLRVTRGGPDA